MTMVKQDLIDGIAEKAGLTKAEASRAIEAVLEMIPAAVAAGQVVEVKGFGRFYPKQRPARIGRNPQTGVEVEIPAKVAPVFKPGKAFKNTVAG